MLEIIVLAVALSMDAFAVSLTLGVRSVRDVRELAILAGLYFGFFQGLMPVLGHVGGLSILNWLGSFTHIVAFLLLVGIGLKMIYEALAAKSEANISAQKYSHYALILLALATSIDALAAGFSLRLMSTNAIAACVLIGLVTFAFSYVGVRIGKRAAKFIGNKAEVFGGLVLILLGLKIVFS